MASEDNGTRRHGRHSAAGKHAVPAADERAVERIEEPLAQAAYDSDQALPTTIPELVPIADGDQETSMNDAPRPIGVDPEATGSFERINAEDGARLTTRINASEAASSRVQNARPVEAVRMSTSGRPKVEHHEVEVKSNRRVFIILGVAALLVVAIIGTLLARALISVEKVNDKPVAEQAQATGDEGIEYRGTTYQLTPKEGGGYSLTSTSDGFEGTAVLYDLAGTPVTLILYNTAFVIPENLPDGTWDLIAYPLGGGSVTQQVTDADGNPIVGQGEIASATLSGDAIQISTTAGEQITVSLV